jgi:hypothetical protein
MEPVKVTKILQIVHPIVNPHVGMEFVKAEKIVPIVLLIVQLLAETVSANLPVEKIPLIVARIVMRLITKRNATTTMFIGMIARDKEQIRPKSAEILNRLTNINVLEIWLKENG